MDITIMADASFCHKSGAASYGYWIASNRGRKGGGGPIKRRLANINEAELMALANTLHVAITENIIRCGDRILMISDSTAALQAVDGKRKKMTANETEALSYIMGLAHKNTLLLRTKHVKGHSGAAEPRFVANHMCDTRAKVALKRARKLVEEGRIK